MDLVWVVETKNKDGSQEIELFKEYAEAKLEQETVETKAADAIEYVIVYEKRVW